MVIVLLALKSAALTIPVAALWHGDRVYLALYIQFEDDVYVATSEPHGNIEAVITRKDMQPHCRL